MYITILFITLPNTINVKAVVGIFSFIPTFYSCQGPRNILKGLLNHNKKMMLSISVAVISEHFCHTPPKPQRLQVTGMDRGGQALLAKITRFAIVLTATELWGYHYVVLWADKFGPNTNLMLFQNYFLERMFFPFKCTVMGREWGGIWSWVHRK